MMPNYQVNNNTIPQPVTPIPTTQPVNTQPIMNSNGYNQQQLINQNNQQSSQISPIAGPLPVNFVSGPQNDN